MSQPPTQDLVTAIDYTTQNLDGSLLNQGFIDLTFNLAIDALAGLAGILFTYDSALNTPVVPNPNFSAATSKWINYGWIRLPFNGAPDTSGTLYFWNINVAPVAVFQQWVTTKVDLTATTAAIVALQAAVVAAQNTATNANTAANNALTAANTASAQATTAASAAAAAQATATTANTNSTAALTAANTANSNATAALASATNALTTATTANNAAQAAQTTANNALGVLTNKSKVTFTTTGGIIKWLCPVGVTSVIALVQAGGGGSGPTPNGSGGGGGGFSVGTVLTTPGTLYNVSVGAGGLGASGSNGGDSYFVDVNTVYAKGGIGGTSVGLTGGAGGAIGIGATTVLPGQNGSAYNDANTAFYGGNSPNGTGGIANTVGGNYGGGGGGAAGATHNGGQGFVELIF